MPPRRPAVPRGPAPRAKPRARDQRAAPSGRTGPARAASPAAGRRGTLGRPVTPVTAVVGVLIVLTLLLTPQLRAWWVQQRGLGQLHAEVAASQRDLAAMRSEREQWNDPDYVRAQARERLHFVLPGETGLTVTTGLPPQARPASGAQGAGVQVPAAAGRPWFGGLWESVRVAGGPPPPPLPSR